MKQSDIEKLIKQGYSIEEIRVALNGLSTIALSSQEKEALGEGRDDRTVYVTPQNGEEKKTSSIMMGYNKQGIELENGEYVNFDEVSEAINKELQTDEPNIVYVSKKTGKKIAKPEVIEELFKDVIAVSNGLKISEDNSIQNQNTARIAIEEYAKNKEHNKGVMMFGNEGIELPNGDYVLISEIESALENYVRMTPSEIIEIEDPTKGQDTKQKPKKEEKYRVIDRIKKKMTIIPIIIAIAGTLATGFKMEPTFTTEVVQNDRTEAIYMVDELHEKSEQELTEEAVERIQDIKTGDKIQMEEGIEYHESSTYKYGGANKSAEFGGKYREAGEYNVEYISILHDGKRVQVKYNEGESLGENLKETADRLGVSISDLESYLHIGGPVAGWVSTDDLVKFQVDKSLEDKNVILETSKNIKVENKDFNGSTISINENGTNVDLKVVDENGNLLNPGSIVTGSNGVKYRIQDYNLEQKLDKEEKQIQTGEHLTWSIHNISSEVALLSAAASLIATKLSKRNDKKMVTLTESKINELVGNARQKFEHESEFQKAVDSLVSKRIKPEIAEKANLKDALIDKQITVEDIENLGGPQL
jgi:hypothetical protein